MNNVCKLTIMQPLVCSFGNVKTYLQAQSGHSFYAILMSPLSPINTISHQHYILNSTLPSLPLNIYFPLPLHEHLPPPLVRTARLYRANFIDASSMSRNVFFNKVLCSWDFSIASEKMAALRHNAIYHELRVSVGMILRG